VFDHLKKRYKTGKNEGEGGRNSALSELEGSDEDLEAAEKRAMKKKFEPENMRVDQL